MATARLKSKRLSESFSVSIKLNYCQNCFDSKPTRGFIFKKKKIKKFRKYGDPTNRTKYDVLKQTRNKKINLKADGFFT